MTQNPNAKSVVRIVAPKDKAVVGTTIKVQWDATIGKRIVRRAYAYAL